MGFQTLVLITALMAIHLAVGCSGQTCSLPVDSCRIQEMTFRLEEAINLATEVTKTLKNAEQMRCTPHPEDCEAVYNCGSTSSGVYTVWPRSRIMKTSVKVFCDMQTAGGGWTVIQRRGNYGRSQDYFYKEWNMYKQGFGDISQDFWIGNDILFSLTNQKPCMLRFDLKDLAEEKRWATYDTFWVDSEENNYTLHVQGYSGDAGDSFGNHNGIPFSAKDRDNDLAKKASCAQLFKGAWWYSKCHSSNLNGLYLNGPHASYADGIDWRTWHGYNYSLPFTEMKIRSISFNPNKRLSKG